MNALIASVGSLMNALIASVGSLMNALIASSPLIVPSSLIASSPFALLFPPSPSPR